MQRSSGDKAKIEYPCKWLYKVIGTDRQKLEQALKKIFSLKQVNMEFSNISKKGNYLAFNLEITVKDEQQRDLFYGELKKHPDIKAVL
jgi:putative lipoic acid-binding regulatory protein